VCVGETLPPVHMRLSPTVTSIVSVVNRDDTCCKGSQSFTVPVFALPWVR